MPTPKQDLTARTNVALGSLLPSCQAIHLWLPFTVRLVLATRSLTFLLLLTLLAHTTAYAASPLDALSAKKMVIARGVGHSVKVHEGEKIVLRGKIVSLGEDAFMLQTGSKPAVPVPYNRVTQVQSSGLPTATKIGITVGAAAVVGVAAVIIYATSGSWYSH